MIRRLVLGVLRAVLPDDWADDIVRDLEEAHARRARGRPGGRRAADLWLLGQALRFAARFGLERLREASPARGAREAAGEALGTLGQDVRHALRAVRAAPVFFAAVILTLAVGIGANTAIFSVVKTVLLDPLPYPESDRLVVIEPYPWTHAEIVLELERVGDSLEEVAGFYPRSFAVTGGEQPLELEGAEVTPGFFGFLGAEMAIGRDFVEADARPGALRTAILSHGAWRRHHGGSPDAIGRSIRVNGIPHEIVGVVERGFRQLTPRTEDPELWVPGRIGRLAADSLPEGSASWVIPVARLGSGVPLRQAQNELDGMLARHLEEHPGENGMWRRAHRWVPLKDWLTGDVRPALLLLQLAVGVVLLLACVNVANLMMVHFSSRQGEAAIRRALGASRGRLFRQLLTESVVIGVLGGLAGLALMAGALELVLAVAPSEVPRIEEVAPDLSVFAFALAVSVATGLLFGVGPAMAATRQAPQLALAEAGRTTAGSRGRHRLSQLLVVAEVTLTLVLLVGAGLLVRSFVSLATQRPGFRTEGILAVRMHVPENRYDSVPRLEGFFERLVERLGQLPQVESLAMSNRVPIERGGSTRLYVVEGETDSRVAQYGVVSPGYFRTLEIPLLRGRGLEDGDRRGGRRVAVIDEALWRDAWPGQDPLGKRFRFVDDDDWITVVGVTGSIRGSGLASEPGPGFYISYQQRSATPVELAVGRRHVFVLVAPQSGETGTADLGDALRRAVWDVDPRQPIAGITTLESIVDEGVAPERFRAVLVGAFAVIALVLAVAGIYGVVGHLLAQRTHEFGIRRALGATDGDVVRSVLAWGVRLTAAGVALGLAGVAAVNRYLTGMLFQVAPTDPPTLLASVLAIAVVTLIACLVPAYRATRIDAVDALRSEVR